jgi:hypothetical protein
MQVVMMMMMMTMMMLMMMIFVLPLLDCDACNQAFSVRPKLLLPSHPLLLHHHCRHKHQRHQH